MREKREESLGNVLDFMRLIWAISHGLQARSKHMEAAFGITGPQRLVIRVLGRIPDTSAGNLAAVLHLHPSTVTGILQRLRERGLLSRIPDPRDARRVRLRLTPKGRRLDTLSQGTVEAAVKDVLRTIAPRKAQMVGEVLTKLAAALAGERTSGVRVARRSRRRRARSRTRSA